MNRVMLWWGRFDPGYSRNRILRRLLRRNGVEIRDFRPRSSFFGTAESLLVDPGPADCIWVPCFRHNDVRSARRYADRNQIPVVFDPLISSWDKVVFERKKYRQDHWKSRRLLSKERALYRACDLVIADTDAHRHFFRTVLNSPAEDTMVIPVGAEEALFRPVDPRPLPEQPEILFFGSFINLQGPQTIVEAAALVPEARWTMLGDGPLRHDCEVLARATDNLRFEAWTDYHLLPDRIGQADIILGIFGKSDKAGRVIPNKVYQALACGRPVITRESTSYPGKVGKDSTGLRFVPPASPERLAACVTELIAAPDAFLQQQLDARRIYETHFSQTIIDAALKSVLSRLDMIPSSS